MYDFLSSAANLDEAVSIILPFVERVCDAFSSSIQPISSLGGQQSWAEHMIIRSLTFHALDLWYTCSTVTDEGLQDEKELEHIPDEDRHLYCELEKLDSEFENKFSQLRLPVIEFLESHWHGRMVEYLSKPGPYDDHHFQQTGNLGIFLEPHEAIIPDAVNYFGNQVREVTSEEELGDVSTLSAA